MSYQNLVLDQGNLCDQCKYFPYLLVDKVWLLKGEITCFNHFWEFKGQRNPNCVTVFLDSHILCNIIFKHRFISLSVILVSIVSKVY